MNIERINNEIIFRLPADTDTLCLQRIIDYLKYKEATKDSKATEEEANQLADESKKSWWKQNKERFIK